MADGLFNFLIMRFRLNNRKEKRELYFMYINRLQIGHAIVLWAFAFMACRAGHPDVETGRSGDTNVSASRDVAVMTVLTHVHESAPAGTLDEVAAVEVLFKSAENADQVFLQQSIPLGGSIVQPLVGISEQLEVEVILYHPGGEEIARNSITAQHLFGTVSVMGFEIAARQPEAACLGCSEPGALIRPSRLHDTALYWSASSYPVNGRRGTLAVAVYPGVDLRAQIAELGDMETLSVIPIESGLPGERGWWRVGSEEVDLLSLALLFAELPHVIGVELEGESGAGRFWP